MRKKVRRWFHGGTKVDLMVAKEQQPCDTGPAAVPCLWMKTALATRWPIPFEPATNIMSVYYSYFLSPYCAVLRMEKIALLTYLLYLLK